MKCPKKIVRDSEYISGCLGLELGTGSDCNEHQVSFLDNRHFLKVDCGDICTTLLIKTIELYPETNSIYGTHMLPQ